MWNAGVSSDKHYSETWRDRTAQSSATTPSMEYSDLSASVSAGQRPWNGVGKAVAQSDDIYAASKSVIDGARALLQDPVSSKRSFTAASSGESDGGVAVWRNHGGDGGVASAAGRAPLLTQQFAESTYASAIRKPPLLSQAELGASALLHAGVGGEMWRNDIASSSSVRSSLPINADRSASLSHLATGSLDVLPDQASYRMAKPAEKQSALPKDTDERLNVREIARMLMEAQKNALQPRAPLLSDLTDSRREVTVEQTATEDVWRSRTNDVNDEPPTKKGESWRLSNEHMEKEKTSQTAEQTARSLVPMVLVDAKNELGGGDKIVATGGAKPHPDEAQNWLKLDRSRSHAESYRIPGLDGTAVNKRKYKAAPVTAPSTEETQKRSSRVRKRKAVASASYRVRLKKLKMTDVHRYFRNPKYRWIMANPPVVALKRLTAETLMQYTAKRKKKYRSAAQVAIELQKRNQSSVVSPKPRPQRPLLTLPPSVERPSLLEHPDGGVVHRFARKSVGAKQRHMPLPSPQARNRLREFNLDGASLAMENDARQLLRGGNGGVRTPLIPTPSPSASLTTATTGTGCQVAYREDTDSFDHAHAGQLSSTQITIPTQQRTLTAEEFDFVRNDVTTLSEQQTCRPSDKFEMAASYLQQSASAGQNQSPDANVNRDLIDVASLPWLSQLKTLAEQQPGHTVVASSNQPTPQQDESEAAIKSKVANSLMETAATLLIRQLQQAKVPQVDRAEVSSKAPLTAEQETSKLLANIDKALNEQRAMMTRDETLAAAPSDSTWQRNTGCGVVQQQRKQLLDYPPVSTNAANYRQERNERPHYSRLSMNAATLSEMALVAQEARQLLADSRQAPPISSRRPLLGQQQSQLDFEQSFSTEAQSRQRRALLDESQDLSQLRPVAKIPPRVGLLQHPESVSPPMSSVEYSRNDPGTARTLAETLGQFNRLAPDSTNAGYHDQAYMRFQELSSQRVQSEQTQISRQQYDDTAAILKQFQETEFELDMTRRSKATRKQAGNLPHADRSSDNPMTVDSRSSKVSFKIAAKQTPSLPQVQRQSASGASSGTSNSGGGRTAPRMLMQSSASSTEGYTASSLRAILKSHIMNPRSPARYDSIVNLRAMQMMAIVDDLLSVGQNQSPLLLPIEKFVEELKIFK